MNPFDILIIMTIELPFPQQVDLIRRWIDDHDHPNDLDHPSFNWWAKHAPSPSDWP